MRVFMVTAMFMVFMVFSGSVLAEGDYPQIYLKPDQIVKDMGKIGGTGLGTGHFEYAFTRDKAQPGHAIKEIAWLTLPVGATVGLHQHVTNEDAYIVISGQGVFVDTAGKETPVQSGDITIARKGESHGIKNTGDVPLVFCYLIAQQQ
ncbi:MAG: cupin domain-containing protein [Deltaproteobacteria bacterium]|jgi:mannose-6-phosphate isomerase-like protein (cupin superfamily)|nr:cupin domain-containing protein [Deltaproteobacteria bacterium]